MRFDKPWQHELASHVEGLTGWRVKVGSDVPDAFLPDGQVLLLAGNDTAA
jgi:hypothetical protein